MAVRGRRRSGKTRRGALRKKLEGILALSLSTPLVTVALTSCHEAGDPSASAPDASTAPLDAADVPDDGAGDDGSACAPLPADPRLFDEDGSCGNFVLLPCGLPPAQRGMGCTASPDLCVAACPAGDFFVCEIAPLTCADGGLIPDAAVYLDCTTCLANVGRRPLGLLPPRKPTGAGLGGYFARVAYMEAASVHAFTQLHARLVAHGAPVRLRRAARRAAGDEKRHARIASRFARSYGAVTEEPAPTDTVLLPLDALALENAVEGCVRETFSALLTLHQAAQAGDARIARAMRRVAEDELAHADLAWAIHRWAAPRLDAKRRARIRRAQEKALAELIASAGAWAPSVVAVAGVPDRRAEQRLAREFRHALFPIGT